VSSNDGTKANPANNDLVKSHSKFNIKELSLSSHILTFALFASSLVAVFHGTLPSHFLFQPFHILIHFLPIYGHAILIIFLHSQYFATSWNRFS